MTTTQAIDTQFVALRSELVVQFRRVGANEATLNAIDQASTLMALHSAITACFGRMISSVYLHATSRVNALIDDQLVSRDAAPDEHLSTPRIVR